MEVLGVECATPYVLLAYLDFYMVGVEGVGCVGY